MVIEKTVLVYDDEEDILELVQRALRTQYHVTTRNRLTHVFDEVQQIRPSVIIIDYQLNGQTSHDTIIQLKQNSHTAHIPIVLFTAYDNIDVIARSLKTDAFLGKPFSLKDLRGCVAKFSSHPVTQNL
ncbi:hypothetical protein GCM10023189_36690 [Nibrella saemangeumensis]|uniref:Response regulatory domain-containing protein n=1 Tax=Nibrella saemangeumensis TaxID=1084526 RepID=A0ABP8N7M8_9BACT